MNAMVFTPATTFQFARCDALLLLLRDNGFLPFINTAFMHSPPPPRINNNNNNKQATVDTTYPNLQCYFCHAVLQHNTFHHHLNLFIAPLTFFFRFHYSHVVVVVVVVVRLERSNNPERYKYRGTVLHSLLLCCPQNS
jgi:hypothetical protein